VPATKTAFTVTKGVVSVLEHRELRCGRCGRRLALYKPFL
jgi:hypothetical protein